MAYSRWGGKGSGYWYTYWRYIENTNKQKEIFEISCLISFTYKELKEDIEKCLDIVYDKDLIKKDFFTSKNLLNELKIYMVKFLNDVENFYKNKNIKKDPLWDLVYGD